MQGARGPRRGDGATPCPDLDAKPVTARRLDELAPGTLVPRFLLTLRLGEAVRALNRRTVIRIGAECEGAEHRTGGDHR